jgi:hypothetical protein
MTILSRAFGAALASVLNAARAQLARRSSPYGTPMTSPRIMRFFFVAHPAVKAR